MVNNPGKAMTIYNIPEIVKVAFPLSMTPNNILNGFSSCGIHPFNPQIFSDLDFAPSSVTESLLPEQSTSAPSLNLSSQEPSTSTSHVESMSECSILTTPDNVRPLPKALERNPSKNIRKKRTSTILTDSPFNNSVRQSNPKRIKIIKSPVKGKGKGKATKKLDKTHRKIKTTVSFVWILGLIVEMLKNGSNVVCAQAGHMNNVQQEDLATFVIIVTLMMIFNCHFQSFLVQTLYFYCCSYICKCFIKYLFSSLNILFLCFSKCI